MADENFDFESMAEFAAKDAAQQLSDRIHAHAKADKRARIVRRTFRWILLTCGAAFFLTVYFELEPRGLRDGIMISSVLLGLICSGVLFCIGGFAPDRLRPTVTRQEKRQIDGRLSREKATQAEEDPSTLQETDDSFRASEIQFPGLPEASNSSTVSRYIESRKRYSRTVSGAIAAIVIYAIWDLLT